VTYIFDIVHGLDAISDRIRVQISNLQSLLENLNSQPARIREHAAGQAGWAR
jgi:hypothetical protein